MVTDSRGYIKVDDELATSAPGIWALGDVVLVDAETKRILGAALFGIEGDEAIHFIVDVMSAGAPYTVITHAVHIHPTVSELIPTLLGNLQPLV